MGGGSAANTLRARSITTFVRIPVQSTAPSTMVQIAAEVELVTDLVIP